MKHLQGYTCFHSIREGGASQGQGVMLAVIKTFTQQATVRQNCTLPRRTNGRITLS